MIRRPSYHSVYTLSIKTSEKLRDKVRTHCAVSMRNHWGSLLLLVLLGSFFVFPEAVLAREMWGGAGFLVASPLERAYVKLPFASEGNRDLFAIGKEDEKGAIDKLCSLLVKEFKRYGWHEDPCLHVQWQTELKTNLGHPLIYAVFGEGPDTTLILGGVHPDELNPVHLAFRFARFLLKNPNEYEGKGFRVVVAPLVNPDGFFKTRPSRTNQGRVDLNRNFLTLDWYAKALDSWLKQRRADPRYFPGFFPNTEIETIFQTGLVEKFSPSKILSLHAPLGFYDYDGPGDQKLHVVTTLETKARDFAKKVAEKSRNYRIADHFFYPGSLGNYAGNERHIPTLTLELQTTNPEMVNNYWDQFLPGFVQSIQYSLR